MNLLTAWEFGIFLCHDTDAFRQDQWFSQEVLFLDIFFSCKGIIGTHSAHPVVAVGDSDIVQAFFESGQLAGECGLSDVQLLGGFCEALFFGYGEETA